jgi:hypothetical protein
MMHENFVDISRREANEMSPLHLPLAPAPQSEEWISKHEDADSHENNTPFQGESRTYYGWQSLSSSLGEQPRSSQPTKSSPIAIIRSHHRGLPGHNDPPRGSEDDDDDDDDDSIMNVEMDALKLQEQYGDEEKIAASYSEERKVSASLLKAPYLGSRSRSENYISLPPMSLSMSMGSRGVSRVEHTTLMEIHAGYGSLRDSHQKGKFLDGPASYRDGRSGQIKRLDHRVRFHASSAQPSISIGERIQQARKKKEIEKQQEQDQKEPATSSLSAMMDSVVIQKSEDTTCYDGEKPTHVHAFAAGDGAARAFGDFNFGAGEEEERNMMSTSLTGIEVLMAANRLRPPPDSLHLAQSYAAPSYNSYLLQPPPPVTMATGDYQTTTGDYYPHFKPLSRSLSDPTPQNMHNPNRSPGLGALQPSQQQRLLQIPASPGWIPYGSMVDPPCMTLGSNHPPSSLLPAGLPSHHHHPPSTMAYPSAPVTIPYHLSSPPDHNPDTDAAFDMDME